MPIRPRSHQLEEESIYNLGIVLPKNWLMSRSDKDYGIDGQIEIFNENNESTGLIFFFQLKATDSHLIKTIQNYRIKTNTILYYLDLPIPVLLLRYSSYQKQFYYKWAHSVDFYHYKPSSKTINVQFIKNWNQEQTPDYITQYIVFYYSIIRNPENVNIDFYFDMPSEELFSLPKGEILFSLKQQIKKISEFINISINLKKNDYFSKIEIKNNTLLINIGEISGFVIHHINEYYSTASFKKNIINDILCGIFYSLLKINYNNIVIGSLFKKYLFKSNIVKIKDIINIEFICLLLKMNLLKGLGLLYKIIKSNNDINICHTLLIYLLSKDTKYTEGKLNKLKKIIAYSEKILKERNSLEELGTLYYNLGNILRVRSKNEKKSINYYKKAAKNNPDYFKRAYFWKEQAGIYFSLGYYKTSELYYKYSLKLGSPNSVLGLRADALMFCGEYKNSYVLFCEYLNKLDSQKDTNYCEFCLKSKFLNTIIENFKIENQKRQPIKAENVFSSNTNSLSLKKIEEAFNYDLLCNIAWYNNGSLKLKKNNYSEALISFLFAALIDQSDLESWGMFIKINTLHKFNNKLFICGLKIAYHYHDDNLLGNLIKWVRNIPDKELTERQKIKLINTLSEIINEISEERKEEKIIRFSLPDGKHIECNL